MDEESYHKKSKAELFAHYEQKEIELVQKRVTENVQIISKKKTLHDSNLILNCLKNHFIFYNLSEAQLENIKEHMFYSDIEEAQFVFEAGQKGMCFFVVEKGALQLIIDGAVKKEIKPQDGFGELALLYNTERNSSVKTKEPCSLWVIDRLSFRAAVEEVIIKDYNQNRKCIESIRFFANITNEHKDLISSALITQKFYKNQALIQEGDPGSSLFYVKEGILSVYKDNKFIRKLGKGDSFGEQSLYYNTMRQLTIKADDEVTCLILGRDTLNRVMNDKVYDVTFKNFIKWAFQKNILLCRLSRMQSEKVIDSMKISSFKANEVVFRRGVSGFQKIVVIIQGCLKKLKNGTVVAIKGQCFGEDYLLQINKSKSLQDQIVMQSSGVLAQITDTVFFESIGGISFEQVIKKAEKNKEKKFPHFQNMAKKQTINLSLLDLVYVCKIAESQFGGVYTVRDLNKNIFALKSFSKAMLNAYDVQKFINEEKKVLSSIASPFIIQLGRAFQTDSHLYYLEEYVFGEDFYDVLKSIGLLSTEDSQFYAANIIAILEYFGENQIVCRDIKPENFMVDSKGYLKLINLSTAKIIRTENNEMSKTFTIIGTPHYMGPDILLGKGYNNLVDLWSLGICIYEFICGVLPFGDSSEGPYEIYEEIMQNQLKFPEFLNDKKAKKLIEQLLNHNPDQRHGGSFLNLKTHPWFEDFDWNDLIRRNEKKIVPPYIPTVNASKVKESAVKASRNLLECFKEIEVEQRESQDMDEESKETFEWASFGEFINQEEEQSV